MKQTCISLYSKWKYYAGVLKKAVIAEEARRRRRSVVYTRAYKSWDFNWILALISSSSLVLFSPIMASISDALPKSELYRNKSRPSSVDGSMHRRWGVMISLARLKVLSQMLDVGEIWLVS